MAISRFALIVPLVVALCALFGVERADANVSCSFNSGALTIQNSTLNFEARIVRSGDNINVHQNSNQTPVNCGAQATVQNTHVIAHNDTSGGESYFTIDLRGGPFAPGQTNEPGNSDEIDIQAVMGAGDDRLYVNGGAGADHWRLGQTAVGVGVNLNANLESAPETPNSDVDLRDAETVVLQPGAGNDRVLANGGPEFTGPLPIRASINADDGDDEVVGGNGADSILDGRGNDRISGGANDDAIIEAAFEPGDDVFDGGPGRDRVGWFDVDAGIRVDLRLTGPQDTGSAGRDVIAGFEEASGSDSDDVLVGTDGDNRLSTGDGNDVMAGLGGADRLSGGDGTDTVSYATPPAGVTQGVTVDLSLGNVDQDTGGAGIDRIDSAGSVIGSPFPDRFLGSQANNRFQIRDGVGDSVTCGPGTDAVVADVETTDVITDECEAIDFDFRPDTKIDAGPPSLSTNASPSFRFSTNKEGATFECSLDGAGFTACDAAHTLPAVADGSHILRVRARDLLGNVDVSPAEHAFSTDANAPRIARARVSKRRRLGFRLSEPAAVRIVVERCAKPRAKRCKRFKRRATLTVRSEMGANEISLARQLRKVKAGRVTLVATDRVGNRSKPVRVGVR